MLSVYSFTYEAKAEVEILRLTDKCLKIHVNLWYDMIW